MCICATAPPRSRRPAACATKRAPDASYPGEGELPLDDFLDAMPRDARIGLEAPCRAYAHLPPVERGRIAGRISRAWMERYEERRAAASTPG